jgi:hypothetical protein
MVNEAGRATAKEDAAQRKAAAILAEVHTQNLAAQRKAAAILAEVHTQDLPAVLASVSGSRPKKDAERVSGLAALVGPSAPDIATLAGTYVMSEQSGERPRASPVLLAHRGRCGLSAVPALKSPQTFIAAQATPSPRSPFCRKTFQWRLRRPGLSSSHALAPRLQPTQRRRRESTATCRCGMTATLCVISTCTPRAPSSDTSTVPSSAFPQARRENCTFRSKPLGWLMRSVSGPLIYTFTVSSDGVLRFHVPRGLWLWKVRAAPRA